MDTSILWEENGKKKKTSTVVGEIMLLVLLVIMCKPCVCIQDAVVGSARSSPQTKMAGLLLNYSTTTYEMGSGCVFL